MLASYSFQRVKYVVSVLFMTPYIILMFSFIGLDNVQIAQERILDTLIGSAIAFVSSYFIFPNWESHQFKKYLKEMLEANYNYLLKAAEGLSGKEFDVTSYKLARKEVYVSSANLGSAFQRMLSEPKSRQINIANIQKFVVLNHSLSSYIATLLATIQENENRLRSSEHIKMIKISMGKLAETIKKLSTDEKVVEAEIKLNDGPATLIDVSSDAELIGDQLNFIQKITSDIQKIADKVD